MTPSFFRAMCLTAAVLAVGCSGETPARLFGKDEAPIPVTVHAKTGDNRPVQFVKDLPSGMRATTVRDRPPEPVIRVRLEEGQFKGLEADVPREAARPAPERP